jgi:hypothetical protein
MPYHNYEALHLCSDVLYGAVSLLSSATDGIEVNAASDEARPEVVDRTRTMQPRIRQAHGLAAALQGWTNNNSRGPLADFWKWDGWQAPTVP